MQSKLLVFLKCMLILASICFVCGCSASHTLSATSSAHYESLEKRAGDGESEIVVVRPDAFSGSAVAMHIFVDGQKKLELRNGKSATVIVPNGVHTVCGRHAWSSKRCDKRAISIDLTSERVVINTAWDIWAIGMLAKVKATKMAQFPLPED